ncbi:MAG: type II toxin-antitoxin system VapC family toxin [Acidobacteriota bacterium]|jgi:predicted nucleic acid-binding protein|nr:type II toxin-antitoxin system VapC family toxin [Acidobacteriota bacterium]
MSWVVDTCVIIDILHNDSRFGEKSAALVDRMVPEGLIVCPVSYIELAPAFLGDKRLQEEFLAAIGVDFTMVWDAEVTRRAHQAWHRQIGLRKMGQVAKRPAADMMIGAFASLQKGLLTRNPDDFKRVFPSLTILTP